MESFMPPNMINALLPVGNRVREPVFRERCVGVRRAIILPGQRMVLRWCQQLAKSVNKTKRDSSLRLTFFALRRGRGVGVYRLLGVWELPSLGKPAPP